MWFIIKHARNGREYRLPELPHFSVDDYCSETNTIYKILAAICTDAPVTFPCRFHHKRRHPRSQINTDIGTFGADNSNWIPGQSSVECEYDDAGIATPEMFAHATVCKSCPCTRDALYGGRSEAMRLHYMDGKARLFSM